MPGPPGPPGPPGIQVSARSLSLTGVGLCVRVHGVCARVFGRAGSWARAARLEALGRLWKCPFPVSRALPAWMVWTGRMANPASG